MAGERSGSLAWKDGVPVSILEVRKAGELSVTVSSVPAETEIQQWDDLVRHEPLSDCAQLTAWSRTRAAVGYNAVYVYVHDDGTLVGGAQILVRRIRGLGALGYVPYGPVVAREAGNRDRISDTIADVLADLGRRRFRMLFVQPPDAGERASQALLERGFRDSDAEVAPAATLRVDVHLDEVELRRRMSRRLRGSMNTWAKHGVTVRQAGADDLPLIAGLLAKTAEHQGFAPLGLDYLSTMYRELAPAGHVVVFIGEVDGAPGTMQLYTGCGTVLKCRLAGLDRSVATGRLELAAAVDWTAIRWARENGYRWFDLGGVLPDSVPLLLSGKRADLEAVPGPDRYKVRLGGQLFRYPPPVEMVPSPLVRSGYDLARRSVAGRALVAWARRQSRGGRSDPSRGPGPARRVARLRSR
jgi:lipid II:glycine glycyltransferase (peptidoglycan interpeptide bridge formation enzyme)